MTELNLDHLLSLLELLSQWITNQKKLDSAWLVEITKTESEFIIKRSVERRQLSELKGLGKELWQKVDVEKYLNEERDSWER
jgi:hypothetical protein